MKKPRLIAWEILNQVILENGYANLLLRKGQYEAEDAAFIHEVVYGTLRHYDLLEYQWKDLAKGKVRPKTAILLDMSIYQLFYLDRVPDYAVVNESVEMASVRDKKFVNAILRKVMERKLIKPTYQDPLEQASFDLSHPLWLMKMWKAHYGEETAIAIAEHDQSRGKVYARINTLLADRERMLSDLKVTLLEDECIRYDGVLTKSEYFSKGEVLIQDRSSQKVPYYLDVKPGMRVLDVCAAPGTKTQQIACLMSNQGEIYANDLHPHRCDLIDQLMQRTGVTICKTFAHDATTPHEQWQENSFDRVLMDVPCSGLGDLRHKPEIRFHVNGDKLDELIILQQQIIETNAKYVKSGGILVYSTCTLNKKENEAQVQNFLRNHPEFEFIQEKTYFPMEYDSDGFYVAQLKKIEGTV